MKSKSSESFQGVSTLPILVLTTDPQFDDGVATFADPLKGPQPGVHVVRPGEMKGDLQKLLSPRDAEFVAGTSALKAAYKANDAAMAREAYITLMPFLDEMGYPVHAPGGKHKFADFYSSKFKDGLLHWPLNHYSRLISSALDEARVVFWWPQRGYSTLAIYCQTWKSALILANYLDRFRMCPCGKLFIPQKTSTVCCSPKHTAYYRLKRWRDRKQPRKRNV